MEEVSTGPSSSVESGNNLSTGNEVSPEAIARVQEAMAQAKQMQGHIGYAKTVNNGIASFVTYVFQELDDSLVGVLYSTCFDLRVTQGEPANMAIVAGFFLPFYPDAVQRFGIAPYYAHIYDGGQPTLVSYAHFLNKLRHHYNHNFRHYLPEQVIKLVTLLLAKYDVIDLRTLTPEQLISLNQSLSKEIYRD